MAKTLHIPDELDLAAFISQEAHDLKSPFNRALGFLKLVLKGMDGPISEQAQEDLTIAYLNMQYALAMINALVDMARLERGEREPTQDIHSAEYIFQQAISEWQRKYHKENSVAISFSAPGVELMADEIMIRQGIQQWISYVNEFVQQDAKIEIQAKSQETGCYFVIQSTGKKVQPPPECDLTMYGFVAQKIVELHAGKLHRLEETEHGAVVEFSLPQPE